MMRSKNRLEGHASDLTPTATPFPKYPSSPWRTTIRVFFVRICVNGHVASNGRREGSEQMSLVQLFVPTEVAHDTVSELGELGNVQFKDVRTQFLTLYNKISD